MRTSSEMYERGMLDAEQDDLNLFYYQHYYHYRKGYDRARRRLKQFRSGETLIPNRRLIFVGVTVTIIVFLGVVGILLLPGLGGHTGTGHSPALGAAPRATVDVLPTPPPARPTLPPTDTPLPVARLGVGVQARVVNLGGAPLRARLGPGVNELATYGFPEGTLVTIMEGPIEADGYTWWRLQDETGSGWSAEQSLDGVAWLLPVQ